MADTAQKITSIIAKLLLPITVFLVPIFYLPVTVDLFDFNKRYLLLVLATLALLVWILHLLFARRVIISITPATGTLTLLALVFLFSSLIQTPTAYLALTGKTGTIFALVLLFVVTTTLAQDKPLLLPTFLALAASVSLSALIVILDYLNLRLPFLPESLHPGPLAFLGFVLPAIPLLFYLGQKSKPLPLKLIFLAGVTLALSAAAAQISATFIQKTQVPPNLPFRAGWVIAIDIFKSGRSAFLGVGPENFVSAFSRSRPTSLNAHPTYWNLRFGTSSNEYLDTLTTTGLLGLFFFLLAFYRPLKAALSDRLQHKDPLIRAVLLGLLTYLTSFLFLPAGISALTVAFSLLALLCLEMKSRRTPGTYDLTLEPLPTGAVIFTWLFCLALFAPTAFFWYHAGRAYAASLATYQAGKLLNSNTTKSYEEQIKAYQLAPQNPNYRINFAQTSLAIAESLSAKTNLSEQDRNTISQLIQQAIRESKKATQIAPTNPLAWENLAGTYKRIQNVAEGASDWAIASYNEAISLDPTNPRLRLDLGGVFYALGDYDSALRQYDLAETLKPDWANVHYNFSAAYKAKKDYAKALASIEKVLGLVSPGSPDYTQAQAEYERLKSLAPQITPVIPN